MATPDSSKRALSTGITGRSSAYLAELLLAKGSEGHGIERRARLVQPVRPNEICKLSVPSQQPCLYPGKPSAPRGWGHARDYVDAMWQMQQPDADNYVPATGKQHSVREFVAAAAVEVGWQPSTGLGERVRETALADYAVATRLRAFDPAHGQSRGTEW